MFGTILLTIYRLGKSKALIGCLRGVERDCCFQRVLRVEKKSQRAYNCRVPSVKSLILTCLKFDFFQRNASSITTAVSQRWATIKSKVIFLFGVLKRFGLYFIPSFVLLAAGISSIIDRSLLPWMIPVAFCALGMLAVILTYKFLVVYSMARDVMSKVDTHVVFQSRNHSNMPTQILDLLDDEDIDPSGQGYH